MRGLKDKVVVVTAGGGGIGGATCRRFSEEGAKVAVFDIDAAASMAVAQAIIRSGGKAGAFTCDIAKHADCQKAVRDAETALGPIDVLVNNAGWDVFRGAAIRRAKFLEIDDALMAKTFAPNVNGTLYCMQALLPHMLSSKHGVIVNMASMAHLRAARARRSITRRPRARWYR